MYTRIIVLLTALSFLSGCATINTYKPPTNFNSSSLQELKGKGVIIGSIVRDTTDKWDAYKLLIRGVNNDVHFTLGLLAGPLLNNEKNIGAPGTIFARELPAGEYEIYQHGRHIGNTMMYSDPAYSVKFTVTEGKIKYIGRILIKHNSVNTGVLGIKHHMLFDWSTINNFNEDIIYFQEKYKSLTLEEIIIDVIDLYKRGNSSPPLMEEFVELDPVDVDNLSEPVKYSKLKSENTYGFSKSFSSISGARNTILINGTKLKLAGSSDGKLILVTIREGLFESLNTPVHQWSRKANLGFKEIKKVLDKNQTSILEVTPVKVAEQVIGYVIQTDTDGYSIIAKYSIE